MIECITVQPPYRLFRRDSKAAAFLAVLLGAVLLISLLLASSHELHHRLHSADSSGDHLCLLCSFAKGQVGAAQAAAVMVIVAVSCFFTLGLLAVSPPASPDWLLAPGRAPPRR